MAEVLWYSQSQKKYVEVASLVPERYAKACLAKVERGEYLDGNGEPLGITEELLLRDHLEAHIAALETAAADALADGVVEGGGVDA